MGEVKVGMQQHRQQSRWRYDEPLRAGLDFETRVMSFASTYVVCVDLALSATSNDNDTKLPAGNALCCHFALAKLDVI